MDYKECMIRAHSADVCGKTPTKTLAESDVGKILSDLNRAKVAFQLRTLCAVLGVK